MRSLVRGLVAGAAGTTVLNATTYLDMALTGRSASSAPADTVTAAADLVHLDLPTAGSREEAYGALAGLGVGVGVGAVAALVRSAGVRLPWLAESAVIGFGAMAATDGPMAVLQVTDLTTWSATDWGRDVVPHLVYGAAVACALRVTEPDDERDDEGPARPGRLLLRSLAIGLATGARSSWGLVPPGLVAGKAPLALAGGLVGTELVFDKLPSTPSRVGGPTVARVLSAAGGAGVLARHEGAAGVWPAVAAGAVGAVAGTVLGSVWRDLCADRSWEAAGAVVEDAVSAALTAYAVAT
ncbi:hypothetical protein [Nocardioides sp. Leaf285]|uniref:hypothetical protein n=1 Tax=Nocardioides sp. Leaf285 TaxID=1736322 RepID=UPI000A560E67|nr:hypothetical protein [Nocardioides sp. Leaf285]